MKFSEWKDRLINSKAVPENDIQIEKPGEIIVYGPGNTFYLGMWLQTKERKIQIYSNDNGNVSLTQRCFTEDRKEGPVHRHDSVELGYVVKGCSRQVFSGQEYLFNEGDFWITDLNCYHSDVYFPDELFTVYIGIPSKVFDVAFFDSVGNSPVQQFIYLALLKQKERCQFLHFSHKENLKTAESLMENIVNEISSRQIGMDNIVKGLLARLFQLSSDYEFLLENQDKAKMDQLIFREVESYIRNNYQKVTIQCLIDRFHYNSDFYNRIIKKNSGYTYSEYLKKIRFEHATSMLINTDLTVSEIIAKIGYQSKGFFYREFYDCYHLTPVKYRKKYKPHLSSSLK